MMGRALPQLQKYRVLYTQHSHILGPIIDHPNNVVLCTFSTREAKKSANRPPALLEKDI